MARTTKPLTNTEVKQAKPKEKVYTLSDGGGLQLRIKPIAAKGSLETAKRLCQRLNEIMVHAVNTGIIKANPLTGISKTFQHPAK